VIVVDTVSGPTGRGHPFGYVCQAEIEPRDDEDIKWMLREYDAERELVVMPKPVTTSAPGEGLPRDASESLYISFMDC